MYSFTELEGRRVRLVPIEPEHGSPLFQCSRDPRIWDSYPVRIDTIEDMNRFIGKALEGRAKKEQFPFAVWDKESNEYVGTTRFLRISEENGNLNIGSTWYSPKAWRTRVNTEAKYLMLKHAFEFLRVCRVELVTSTNNGRSQAAIERLGAIKEGLLRKKYYGLDYYVYSIVDSEWSGVKSRLEGFLADGGYAE